MANKFIAASTLRELEFILNGGVIGGKQLASPEGVVHGLNGLTLIINTTTVTFTDTTGAGYKLNDAVKSIKQEIEDAVAGVTVEFLEGGRLGLKHATGVTLDKDGTANALFGFGKTTDIVGTVYAPPDGTAPRVLGTGASPRGDNYYAHCEV